ncbi:unnamed protein product [Mesocestoides corti]|uniref:Galactokinase n=1 Tax=Mesocestoides corti TaxID=53468 RepID=A0A158QU38_MESCO|nr:unnamed protein product [Mesocestoides corti]
MMIDRCPEVQRCQFIVRAPGRVNIIGEHIDYNGYAVLPMALNQAIYVAVAYLPRKEQRKIKIMSECPSFETFEADIETALQFAKNGPPQPPRWYHYVLCGYCGFYEYAKQEFPQNWVAPSICLLVGNGQDPAYVPMCAGLSSSSALVVAAAMATMRASNTFVEPRVLACICAKCERLIGTQGGGMDQAACLLADSSPIIIEFGQSRIKTTSVIIPPGGVFVIADSGARLNKASTPDYNTRVSQCKEALRVFMSQLPESYTPDELGSRTLSDVQAAFGLAEPGQMLGENSPFADAFPENEGQSIPARRAKHCYAEAQRVIDFRKLCDENLRLDRDNSGNDETLQKLGKLMNASHQSCRELYDCSCPELDRLVEVCRSAGSYGSRLTGAGWGGCVVSLVPEGKIQQFINKVAKDYFSRPPGDLVKQLFYTTPGRAAGFIEVSGL